MEEGELALDESEISLDEEALGFQEDAAKAYREKQGDVEIAWDECELSLVPVKAYKTYNGSTYWGTYPAGLVFAHLGQAGGRFRNWWGPGDPFPGQGAAYINLSQTTPVACPW